MRLLSEYTGRVHPGYTHCTAEVSCSSVMPWKAQSLFFDLIAILSNINPCAKFAVAWAVYAAWRSERQIGEDSTPPRPHVTARQAHALLVVHITGMMGVARDMDLWPLQTWIAENAMLPPRLAAT